MKESPILFSTPMVQAILENRKSQTRRVITPQPEWIEQDIKYRAISSGWWWKDEIKGIDNRSLFAKILVDAWAPYKPGDALWVRETWCNVNKPEFTPEYYYFADTKYVEDYDSSEWKWRSPRFMPRTAARIFLRVTDVRAERVQDISTEDCVAEGAVSKPHYMRYGGETCLVIHNRYKKEYADLWDSLNSKRGYGWDVNPWVWVVKFERCAKPAGWPTAA